MASAGKIDDSHSIKRKVKPLEANSTNVLPQRKGAWTPEEDRRLAQAIAVHGPKRWKFIAARAGLNRHEKSCRLRWFNYLRPNLKRGNISDQEEDLIIRLHKLLGNRWSLIAGRLPGRTDNEIKNYWNCHLAKKIEQREKRTEYCSTRQDKQMVEEIPAESSELLTEENNNNNLNEGGEDSSSKLHFEVNANGLFDLSDEGPLNLEWVSKFLELD